MQELGEQETPILENKGKLDECDVLCLCYDSSDPESFSYIVSLIDKFDYLKELPIVFVALKADLDKQQQRCHIQPDDFADQLFIDHPLHISSTWPSSLNELFIKLTEVALEPITSTAGLGPAVLTNDIDYRQTIVAISSVVGFASLFTFTALKIYSSFKNT